MARKDYIVIAATLRSGYANNLYKSTRSYVAACEMFCDKLQADNSRFDRARFLGACGI